MLGRSLKPKVSEAKRGRESGRVGKGENVKQGRQEALLSPPGRQAGRQAGFLSASLWHKLRETGERSEKGFSKGEVGDQKERAEKILNLR